MIGLLIWLAVVIAGISYLTQEMLRSSSARVERLVEDATSIENEERDLMERLREFEEQVHIRWPSEVDR